ncbi:uncharacterized protein LOC142337183 isoform X1 [Convolutriloba macropyga]|uniref:uncharacterized protein LOC142337183 isoform X1 n=1 Tax=Convolutriloba macropyga TaxID=536237 RepID=UPI003F524DCE
MTCKDNFGLSALHYGILLNCFEVVESIAVQLKELAISVDSEPLSLSGRISPLMLACNLNFEERMYKIKELLHSLGCSARLRDTWKQLDSFQWESIGVNQGVFLTSVLFRPQSDRHDSLILLSGRVKCDSRKDFGGVGGECGVDPLLTTLYERGKLRHHDRLHQRQLNRLNVAIRQDRQPETFHEILTELQKHKIEPEESNSAVEVSPQPITDSTVNETIKSEGRKLSSADIGSHKSLPPIGMQRSHSVTDLLAIYSEQHTSAFRKRAKVPTPPRVTPSPTDMAVAASALGTAGPNNGMPAMVLPRSARRKMNALAAMGARPPVAGGKGQFGKKLSVSMKVAADGTKSPISRSKSPISGARSPKLITGTKVGGVSMNSMYGELLKLQNKDLNNLELYGGSEGGCSSQNSLNSSFNVSFSHY